MLLRANGGLVVRRDHPELGGSFDWLIREGRLAMVLPGVYATPEIARTWQTRARALALHHRDAVLIGAAAARVSFWPTAPLIHVEAAIRGALKPQPGFSFCRRRIPEELIAVRGGLRYTVPALTAIDLATFECSDAIDTALRVRAATLAGMYEALRMTPHRAGNLEKLKLLIDSRNEPWVGRRTSESPTAACCAYYGLGDKSAGVYRRSGVLPRHCVQAPEVGDRD